jgi:hypothetical protein
MGDSPCRKDSSAPLGRTLKSNPRSFKSSTRRGEAEARINGAVKKRPMKISTFAKFHDLVYKILSGFLQSLCLSNMEETSWSFQDRILHGKEFFMKRKGVIFSILLLTLFSGTLLFDQAVFAADKTVQLTIPGCTT